MRPTLIIAIATLGVALAIPSTSPAKTKATFSDFSTKGPEYRSLENLRFAADSVTYLGTKQVEILDKSYAAEQYSVAATIRVQTFCGLGVNGAPDIQEYERVSADFVVSVVEDADRKIHDEITQGMYAIWSRKEIYSGKYYYDFNQRGEAYSLTVIPDAVSGDFYYVWVTGRVAKVSFGGFRDRDKTGWGPMDSFTRNHLRILLGTGEYKAYSLPFGVRRDFMRLYPARFKPNSDRAAK